MNQIDRRLRKIEGKLPPFDYSRVSDGDMRAMVIEEFAEAVPEHAAALRRAGERIAAGTPWPAIGSCIDLTTEARALLTALLVIGQDQGASTLARAVHAGVRSKHTLDNSEGHSGLTQGGQQ